MLGKATKQKKKSSKYGSTEKVKTTLMLDVTTKKLAQIYAVKNDMTLQEVVEKALKKFLL